MKKSVLVLLIALAACGFVFAGGQKSSGAQSSAVKIGIAVPTADHGWTGGVGWYADYTVEQIKKTAGNAIEFRVVHSANATQQVSDVENLAIWGMNYLVILPHESAPLTAPVKQLHDRGVKCIVVDRGLTDTSFGYVNIAGDNSGLGRFSGEWLAKTMKAEGLTNYVAMGGMPVVIDTERMDAFFAEMNREPSLVNLLGGNKYEFANWSVQDGLKIMETFLTQYPKIDAVYCQDDDVLTGVMQAIKESGRQDIKLVLGGAGSKVVYKMIIDNDPLVRATALYHPSMIADGIQFAVDVATGARDDSFHNASQPFSVVIPSALIDKSNVNQYYNPDSTF
ncbi:MAG: substrate-binding domain-containing protein [Spirochaetaceae bacterium]|jgi:ribose transport system substrate-binding protein|nr:substrate-binding domain-containing protein [Spirochaetaceae bacterium]